MLFIMSDIYKMQSEFFVPKAYKKESYFRTITMICVYSLDIIYYFYQLKMNSFKNLLKCCIVFLQPQRLWPPLKIRKLKWGSKRPWLSLCPTVYKADLYGSQLQITGCGFLKSCTFFSAYLSEETDFCRNL